MSVTYPNLRALIAINFVGAVIGGFKESSNIFAMTGGGPEDSTMTVGLHIWYNAFMFLNFGMATAMAWIMGALLIGFTLKQLQILNKLTFRSTTVEAETNGGTA
jgi:multiple sugar transport system permease protein